MIARAACRIAYVTPALILPLAQDGEGGISHSEFVQAMRRWGMRESSEQLHWVAQAIDVRSSRSLLSHHSLPAHPVHCLSSPTT
jgi:hypothetical protein